MAIIIPHSAKYRVTHFSSLDKEYRTAKYWKYLKIPFFCIHFVAILSTNQAEG